MTIYIRCSVELTKADEASARQYRYARKWIAFTKWPLKEEEVWIEEIRRYLVVDKIRHNPTLAQDPKLPTVEVILEPVDIDTLERLIDSKEWEGNKADTV